MLYIEIFDCSTETYVSAKNVTIMFHFNFHYANKKTRLCEVQSLVVDVIE